MCSRAELGRVGLRRVEESRTVERVGKSRVKYLRLGFINVERARTYRRVEKIKKNINNKEKRRKE